MEEKIKRYEEITGRKFNLFIEDESVYVFEDEVEEEINVFLTAEDIEGAIASYEERAKRPFKVEFSLSHDFSFVSNWIRKDQFELLKEEVSKVRDEYLRFLNSQFKESDAPPYKGVETTYYELDGDDFGNYALPNHVLKWLITFNPKYEEEFKEIIKG